MSVAASPISWQHHLVWLVLIAPVTTLTRQVDVPFVGALLVNTCGLTAVAAAVLLPRLVTWSDVPSAARAGDQQQARHG